MCAKQPIDSLLLLDLREMAPPLNNPCRNLSHSFLALEMGLSHSQAANSIGKIERASLLKTAIANSGELNSNLDLAFTLSNYLKIQNYSCHGIAILI